MQKDRDEVAVLSAVSCFIRRSLTCIQNSTIRETYKLFSRKSMQTVRTDPQEIRNDKSTIFQEIRSNYGRSFCIHCNVDSKDPPPSCSFSRLKELGPFHTGKKCQMEQETSGISKFPEKRTTSRGEPKFSKRITGKFLFHSILNRNFRKFWSNGTRP